VISMAYSDLILVSSDSMQIPVHRFALGGQSPVLQKFITTQGDMHQGKMFFNSVGSKILLNVIRFIYTGQINDFENCLFEYLRFAKDYAMKSLQEKCMQKLTESITAENVFDRFAFAYDYNHEELKTKCFDFFET
jgi:speckle-type POZ protein